MIVREVQHISSHTGPSRAVGVVVFCLYINRFFEVDCGDVLMTLVLDFDKGCDIDFAPLQIACGDVAKTLDCPFTRGNQVGKVQSLLILSKALAVA